MAQPNLRPEPPILKRDGFQICHDRFSAAAGDVARVEGSRLRELFNPLGLQLKRDQQEAEKSARKLFKRIFFVGQLKHYGIAFPPAITSIDLRELLRDSVFQGKCDEVPESVIHLKQLMERDYEPQYRKWELEAQAWDARKKQQEDEAFSKCKTAGERAATDLDRFLNHYFLTNGQPDKLKTPEPLALHGYPDRWELHEMVQKIPGLEVRSGGTGNNRTLCIGWGLPAVWGLVRDLDAQEKKLEKERREARWEKAMKAHQKYLSQSSQADSPEGASTRTTNNGGSQSFNLESCQGSYIIKCDAVTEGWREESTGDKLTLDIGHAKGGILHAAFHFGIIKGTMLLCLSQETLKEMDSSDDDTDPDVSAGSSVSGDSDEEDHQPGEKRKPEELVEDAAANPEAGEGSGHAAKRRRVTPSPARRVYYRIRGRETGEGEVFPDSGPGHIDFLDDGCTSFAGLAYYFPYIGKDVKFEGYKLSDLPKKKPQSWKAFAW